MEIPQFVSMLIQSFKHIGNAVNSAFREVERGCECLAKAVERG